MPTREELLEDCAREVDPPPEEQPLPSPDPILSAMVKRAMPQLMEWVCPDCRNHFSWEDGSRTLTKNSKCPCIMMPYPIRKLRIDKGRSEQAML